MEVTGGGEWETAHIGFNEDRLRGALSDTR